MHKYLPVALAYLLLAATCGAGEEFMTMHPGDGEYRRLSSTDRTRQGPAERPQLHRNAVTLQLPSLGPRSENRTRVVGAQNSGIDGSLNFHAVGPASLDPVSEIPGLVVPEMLAGDRYTLDNPEPVRSHRAVETNIPSPTPESFGAAPVRSLAPVGYGHDDDRQFDMGGPAGRPRSRDYPESQPPRGVAFARIEIPAPAASPQPIQPEPVFLPAPVAVAEQRSSLAAAAEAPPSTLRPTASAPGSLRPPKAEVAAFEQSAAETASPAPQAWTESIPASGAVFADSVETVEPVRPVARRARRVSMPARPVPAEPVRELQDALGPIYR